MNGTMKNLFIFVMGAGVGSVLTWKLIRDRYEQLVQEEIASVKEVFSRREQKPNEENNDIQDETNDEKPLREVYNEIIQDRDYTSYSEKKEKITTVDKPYVITPEEAGMLDGYELFSLKYYSDGVLVDDNDEPIDDVDATVGLDSLETFGQYEDDAVYVRNDARKCDFEILKDLDEYSDVVSKKPHRVED